MPRGSSSRTDLAVLKTIQEEERDALTLGPLVPVCREKRHLSSTTSPHSQTNSGLWPNLARILG
jgi:hypothetical protein